MTARDPAGRRGALWLLSIISLGVLAGVVVHRRALRIRDAYAAHRLLERQGHLRNELRWQQARHARRTTVTMLLEDARAGEITVARTRDNVRVVPAGAPVETGQ